MGETRRKFDRDFREGAVVGLAATVLGLAALGLGKAEKNRKGKDDHPINAKVEKALREAIGSVPRVEADQIAAPIAVLDDRERAEALGLAIIITCYVAVDVCDSQWPVQTSVRRIAEDLATGTTTAERLHLDAKEIYAYLSRTVLGPERLEDVIPDEPAFTRLPIIVAGEALAVYSPKEMGMWDYLDRIESAIEIASALDASVLPAAVMRAYLPKPEAGGQPHSA
jgi:hypothetical protein